MQGIDEERINEFFSTYGGTLGPEGNIPCLNSGVMPLGYRITGLLSSTPPDQIVTVTKITVVTTDAAMPRAEIVAAPKSLTVYG